MRTNDDDARCGRLRVCGRDTNGSGRQRSTAPVDGVLPQRWCRATPSVALLCLSLARSLAQCRGVRDTAEDALAASLNDGVLVSVRQ